MFKIGIQLEPKRKALYEEAIRRLRNVCVSMGPHPDGLIVEPKDALSEMTIPCLVDQPQSMDKHTLVSLIQSNRNVMPAHEWRFSPKIQPMYEALVAGKLGKPGLLRLHDWSLGNTPLRQRMFGPVDVACWFFQDEPVASHTVHARGSLLCHLKFPSDGMALLDVSNHSEGERGYESIQLIGATGAVYGDDHHNTHLHFKKESVSARVHRLDEGHGLMGMVDDFVNGLSMGRDWRVSLKDTHRVFEQMKEVTDG